MIVHNDKYQFKSTYGLRKDWSYRGELFYRFSSSWRPGSRPILNIRVANWTPKVSRENSAIIYYDVTSTEKAQEILTHYTNFNFKRIENEFEKMWVKDNFEDKGFFNSGETDYWWNNKFLPYIRQFIIDNQKKLKI